MEHNELREVRETRASVRITGFKFGALAVEVAYVLIAHNTEYPLIMRLERTELADLLDLKDKLTSEAHAWLEHHEQERRVLRWVGQQWDL